MKIRTPNCECIICHDDGRPIIRSRDARGTYFAIKKMRQLLDAIAAEQTAPPTKTQSEITSGDETVTEPLVDYDNTCESVGVRLQDGDHLVKAAVSEYATCKTARDVKRKAIVLRDMAVQQGKFLAALIYDTIYNDAQREIENE